MSTFPSEISQLSPTTLWQFFDKVCSIPHPSKHEENLAQYIVQWATEQKLDVRRDPTGNIIIKKAATLGMENKKGVVLQAHLDMVPQKNADFDHDFIQDPIQPFIDGEWVTANNTTLGADNGIGMATCLAILASKDVKHGPLEVLLTIDEEAGMTGAFGLEAGWLEGDILLNTDSEQEGEVYMGCAGGIDGEISLDIARESLPQDYRTHQIAIKGLKGGHSGCDIHTGRGNANKLLARFLASHAQELGLRLITFNGGSLRNAIPREAHATVAFPTNNKKAFEDLFNHYTQLLQKELGQVETELTSSNEQINSDEMALSIADQQRFLATLNACPNGVMRMDDHFSGVVETSINVGVVTTQENSIQILCLIRSLIDSGRQQVESTLTSIAELAQASIRFSGAYPGWKPDSNSEIMAIFRTMYENIYGNKPNIMVIHAGLECGLFKKPYPKMDMLSFGPTIKFPHSPDEKVHIHSVARFWEQMVALLKVIPERV